METVKYGVADDHMGLYVDERLWWQYVSAAEGFDCFEFHELRPDSLFDTEEEASAFARDIVEWPYDDVAYVVKIYDNGKIEVIKGIKSKHGPMGFGRDDFELEDAVVYSGN